MQARSLLCLSIFLAMTLLASDGESQTTQRVSVSSTGAQAALASTLHDISDDGNFVVFSSTAGNLVPGDTNGQTDIFVHSRPTGLTTRVSVDSNGTQGNGTCGVVSASPDVRWLAFASDSTNLVLGDTNGSTDIFVHDAATSTTIRGSLPATGTQANGSCSNPTSAVHGIRRGSAGVRSRTGACGKGFAARKWM